MTDADATALPADGERTPVPHRAICRLARRRVLWLAASAPLMMGASMTADAATPTGASLLTAPLSLAGSWRGSAPGDVLAVLGRMRAACLDGIRLVSDRQPTALRVQDVASGPPHVWLHTDAPGTAIVAVDVGARDWINLSYQFGHELGHVMANSWMWGDAPRNPCQWLEEAVVEAFSLRGLGRLAEGWAVAPPFPHNNAYAAPIRAYRRNLLEQDLAEARAQGADAGLGGWYAAQAGFLATHGTVIAARPAVPAVLELLEADETAVADIGALNRWPERSHLPLGTYLARWRESCAELGLAGLLPGELARLLKPGR
ncbi:hypothetical protein ACMV_07940 [Acidiphilium multivorum AIU301]|uniref:Peptidase M48 domain-containing protein n=2 Tax=Acidocellaceae TaxID=3385905 RepID=F0J592_ACIMA|nr:hypothetical protein ACMV_07940 [Acidiphilium multivorum AIU301]